MHILLVDLRLHAKCRKCKNAKRCVYAVKTEIFVYLQGYARQERFMTQAKTHLFWFDKYSAAASGWAGWALAHPEFGSLVNPITTRGADTASPPGFEIPAASLINI